MLKFWYSRKNLIRTIYNIMTLFHAVDSDFDNFEKAIGRLDERIDEIREILYKDIAYLGDDIADSESDVLLDSDGQIVRSQTKIRIMKG